MPWLLRSIVYVSSFGVDLYMLSWLIVISVLRLILSKRTAPDHGKMNFSHLFPIFPAMAPTDKACQLEVGLAVFAACPPGDQRNNNPCFPNSCDLALYSPWVLVVTCFGTLHTWDLSAPTGLANYTLQHSSLPT